MIYAAHNPAHSPWVMVGAAKWGKVQYAPTWGPRRREALTLDQPSHSWRTSSYCDKIDCVAVCRLEDGTIGMTNTSDPDMRVLVVATEALADWVEGIKAGAFDDLI